MRICKKQAIAIAVLCSLSTGALAQQDAGVHPFISSKYSVQLGAFLPSKDFKLNVDGTIAGIDQEFDFEKATGFSEDDEIFMLEFKWRFGDKWSTRLQYYASDQSRKAVLEEDILWGNQIIAAGSSVTASANFSLARVFFGRSFDGRANVDSGIGVGLHWLEIGALIKPDFNTISSVSAAKVSGPLPNIGGWYYYSPSPKWFIGGRLDWLEASIDKYNGGIVNISAGVNYQMFRNVGIGLKYQFFRINVDVDNDKWHGGVELDYEGPYLYLSANFK
jgi:opacity protein-like surface antigen